MFQPSGCSTIWTPMETDDLLAELSSLLENDYSDQLDIADVQSIMDGVDGDGDGMIDITEFIESIEEYETFETLVEEKGVPNSDAKANDVQIMERQRLAHLARDLWHPHRCVHRQRNVRYWTVRAATLRTNRTTRVSFPAGTSKRVISTRATRNSRKTVARIS